MKPNSNLELSKKASDTATFPILISVFIVTKNEENNLPRLLNSVKNFKEIIVVDSGSDDKTVDIAKSYGAKVYTKVWEGYSKQKQFALEKCTCDWVLNMDADEELSFDLIHEISELIQNALIDGVRFIRDDLFINSKTPTRLKKRSNLRLYRRNRAKFRPDKLVHESASVNGKIVTAKHSFVHHGYNDVSSLIAKTNDYSKLKATEKHQHAENASIFKLVLIFQIELFRKLIIQRMIFWGKRGLIRATIDAFYAFQKEAKLHEIELRNK